MTLKSPTYSCDKNIYISTKNVNNINLNDNFLSCRHILGAPAMS